MVQPHPPDADPGLFQRQVRLDGSAVEDTMARGDPLASEMRMLHQSRNYGRTTTQDMATAWVKIGATMMNGLGKAGTTGPGRTAGAAGHRLVKILGGLHGK